MKPPLAEQAAVLGSYAQFDPVVLTFWAFFICSSFLATGDIGMRRNREQGGERETDRKREGG